MVCAHYFCRYLTMNSSRSLVPLLPSDNTIYSVPLVGMYVCVCVCVCVCVNVSGSSIGGAMYMYITLS